MALKIVKGDIFDPKLDKVSRVIVHGCNAQGVMGSGIAKTIRDMYPEVYQDYKHRESSRGKLIMGEIIHTVINLETLSIYSIISQRYYGRDPSIVYVDYKAVRRALKDIASHINFLNAAGNPFRKIHIPFIGGGLANGDRAILLGIFEEVFKDSDATLFIKD